MGFEVEGVGMRVYGLVGWDCCCISRLTKACAT